MKGSCTIISPASPVEYRTFTGVVAVDYWQEIVGGLIELLPKFSHWEDHYGQFRPCVAFANEEGMLLQLPPNHSATAIWQYLHIMIGHTETVPLLHGPVVIIFGDNDFLEAL